MKLADVIPVLVMHALGEKGRNTEMKKKQIGQRTSLITSGNLTSAKEQFKNPTHIQSSWSSG